MTKAGAAAVIAAPSATAASGPGENDTPAPRDQSVDGDNTGNN